MHNIVCVNTIDIDGRLFSTPAPVYADLKELRWIAQIPDAIDCALFVGLDDQPLRGNARANLFPGVQLRFTYEHRFEPESAFLPELLLSRSFWVAAVAVRRPNLRHAYCLATDAWYRLHVDDFSQPFCFRQHVAACLGVPVNSFRLCPSRPALTNVEVEGVACNTVIAVARTPALSPPDTTILLDCRPILEGLRSLQVRSGFLSVEAVCRVMQADAPMGQFVHLREAQSLTDQPLVAGQVLTVEYVAASDSLHPLQASGVTPSATVDDASPQENPDTGGTGGNLSPSSHSHDSADNSPSEDTADPASAPEHAAHGAVDSETSIFAVILCPEYKPEVCAVCTSLPTTPAWCYSVG